MLERETEFQLPSSVDILKGEAQSRIEMAFECDPSLVIRGGKTMYGDLSVRHKNILHPYRDGDESDMCIYYIPSEEEILISQVYPDGNRMDGNPLRIFLDPNSQSPATYYTAKPHNWYKTETGSYIDMEKAMSRERGLRDRAESVLMAAEHNTRTFILYQRYFAEKRGSLDIPKERLSGPKLSPFELYHHIRTLEMLEEIRDHQRSFKFNNYGGGVLPMYDHDPYISHKVHM